MTTRKIYEYINHPELIDSKTFREFDDILEKYPYFQLVRILYLRALYVQNSHRFQQELKNATLYIADKKQLYLYLSGQLDISHLTDISMAPAVDDKTTPEVKSSEKVSLREEKIPTQESKQEKVVSERELAESEAIQEYSKNEASDIGSEDIIDFSRPEKTTSESSNEKKEDVLDFILNEINTEPAYSLENSLGVESDKEYNLDKLSKELKEKQKTKLIDDFIETTPDMPKSEKSEFENINLAELSSHDDSCMTETLAKIYVKQGLYSKAIAVYNKLSLKNPQKSVYFVEKISEIKKIINDKL